MPAVFKCVPSQLEKNAVLRICDTGLARAHAEKVRVEQFDVPQHSVHRNVAGVVERCLRHAGNAEFSSAESAQTFLAGAEMTPKLVDIVGLWKSSRHSYDSDRRQFFGRHC